jgi:hypothetical protein
MGRQERGTGVRITLLPMLTVAIVFPSTLVLIDEPGPREREYGSRHVDTAGEGHRGACGPLGTWYSASHARQHYDCPGRTSQTSAKRNAELEQDLDLREAEAVLAGANST